MDRKQETCRTCQKDLAHNCLIPSNARYNGGSLGLFSNIAEGVRRKGNLSIYTLIVLFRDNNYCHSWILIALRKK